MARDKQIPPVIQRHYDFLLWLMERVEKFPRPSRPVLGDRIEETALNILQLLIAANYTRDRLRFLIRIARDRKFIAHSQYTFAAESMNEVGRQMGG